MNVKLGDLAVMISSDYPENEGKLCEVIEASIDGDIVSVWGPCWVVRSLGSPFKSQDWDTEIDSIDMEVDCPDSDLRPITPPADSTTIERETEREGT